MKLIFGKETCLECKKLKYRLEKAGISYKFMDLATADGLAEAAIRGLIPACETSIPVVVDTVEQ